jgi:hypothetical protein
MKEKEKKECDGRPDTVVLLRSEPGSESDAVLTHTLQDCHQYMTVQVTRIRVVIDSVVTIMRCKIERSR